MRLFAEVIQKVVCSNSLVWSEVHCICDGPCAAWNWWSNSWHAFVQPLNIWTCNFRELSHARGELQLLIDDWILDYNYSFIDM